MIACGSATSGPTCRYARVRVNPVTAKHPDIAARLRTHPDITSRRSRAVLITGAAAAAVILIGWVILLANSAALTAEFAELQDGAVTLNQRVGSRFGVLIGIIGMPIFALLVLLSAFLLSRRFARRATGTPLRKTFSGAWNSTPEQGAAFQEMLRTRDPNVIGSMNAGADKGSLLVEGWSADADRVAYVGVYHFGLQADPGWELVEFAGENFARYDAIFRPGDAARSRS